MESKEVDRIDNKVVEDLDKEESQDSDISVHCPLVEKIKDKIRKGELQ